MNAEFEGGTGGLTTWPPLSVPVLLAKLPSSRYVAETVCVPTAKALVLKEALVTPLVVLTFTGLPTLLPSIWNWTVPVGVPAPGAVMLTVAVMVMLCRKADGLADDVTAVFVAAWLMVCVRLALLPAKVLSPL